MPPIDDPQLRAGLAAMQKFFPHGLDVDNIAATRALLARLQAKRPAPRLADVSIEDVQITVRTLENLRAGVRVSTANAACSSLADAAAASVPSSVISPAIASTDACGDSTTLPPPASGAPPLTLRCYQPRAARGEPRPALLWCHGGGFMFGELSWDDKRCQQLALALDCLVVAVDYRLAPEQPFPAALEDGYAALCWMADHAASLGIDRSRIAVAGASAGGGLAAGLALLARDCGQPSVCFQLLLYPMLDDRTVLAPTTLDTSAQDSCAQNSPASTPVNTSVCAAALPTAIPTSLPTSLTTTPGWSLEENTAGWQCYLGVRSTLQSSVLAANPRAANAVQDGAPSAVSAYAAPSRATDLSALPPAFIAVGSIDLFYGECCDYAARLQQAGVAVELQCYANAFHGFDSWASASNTAKRCWAEQCAALQQAFYSNKDHTR